MLPRALLLLIVTFAALTAGPAAQMIQCPFEESAAAGRLRTVLTALRQPDLLTMKKTLESIWADGAQNRESFDAALVTVSRLMLQGKGFQEIRLCTPRPNLALAVLRNDLTDAADQVAVEVGDSPDARVVHLFATQSTRRIGELPINASDEEKIDALQKYVDRLAAAGAFSGVVLVGRGDKTILGRAWGEANRETHGSITLDTPFNLASLNKIMTATAVLQLVEAKQLSLDAEVAPLLATTSTDPRFSQIRVKHLLSHTSGLDRDPNALAFAPGTSFLYSNFGFRLLGEIVARLSGMRFEDYLRLKIFGPNGMASTGRYELSAMSPLLTIGYTLEPLDTTKSPGPVPSWQPNPYLHTISGGAMGGLYSTGPDVLRFAQALRAGRLVTPATVDVMRTAKPELGAPGYGFGVMPDRTPGIWGHGGDLPGADTVLEFYAGDYVVVILANMDNVTAPIVRTTRALFHRPSNGG
jgi:D-alanyl-D-alanine carboxypeptidase